MSELYQITSGFTQMNELGQSVCWFFLVFSILKYDASQVRQLLLPLAKSGDTEGNLAQFF